MEQEQQFVKFALQPNLKASMNIYIRYYSPERKEKGIAGKIKFELTQISPRGFPTISGDVSMYF